MAKKVWTRDMIVQHIREMYAAKHDLRHGVVQTTNPRLISAAIRYFGSWRDAVLAAGIDYSIVEKSSEQARIDKITKWSKERIVEMMQELADTGEDMRSSIIRNKYPSLFSAATSRRYFGSWGAAVEAAGLDHERIKGRRAQAAPQPRGGWRRELVLEAIAELLPNPDVPAKLARQLYPDLYEEAVRGFGSWMAARKVAIKSSR